MITIKLHLDYLNPGLHAAANINTYAIQDLISI